MSHGGLAFELSAVFIPGRIGYTVIGVVFIIYSCMAKIRRN